MQARLAMVSGVVGCILAQAFPQEISPTPQEMPLDGDGPTVVMFIPSPIQAADVQWLTQRLGLSEPQIAYLNGRYEAYLSSYEDLRGSSMVEVWSLSAELAQTRGFSSQTAELCERLFDGRSKLLDAISATDDRFFDVVSAALTEHQRGELEAQQRRRARLRDNVFESMIPLVTIDLVQELLVLDLDPHEWTTIIELADEYEKALAPVTHERAKRRASLLRQSHRFIAEGRLDERNLALEEIVRVETRGRRINEDFLSRFMAALAPESAARLLAAVNRRAYPGIFPDRLDAGGSLDAALAIETLSPEQRLALADLQSAFKSEYDALNRRMVEAFVDFRVMFAKSERMSQDARAQFENAQDEALRRRDLLNEATLKSIRAALEPEQIRFIEGLSQTGRSGDQAERRN